MKKPLRKPFSRDHSLGDYRRYSREEWRLSWRLVRIQMQTGNALDGGVHPLLWKARLVYDQRKSLDSLLIPADGRLIGKEIVDLVLAERAQDFAGEPGSPSP